MSRVPGRINGVVIAFLLSVVAAGADEKVDAKKGEARVKALISDLDSEDIAVRLKTVKELRALGPKAAAAVPRLMLMWRKCVGRSTFGPNPNRRQERDYEVRSAAEMAVIYIGKPAVPALIAVAMDDELGDAISAINSLGIIGPDAAKGVKVIIANLGSTHPLIGELVRKTSADALGEIGPLAKDALKALSGALTDPDPKVRAAVYRALKRIDPDYASRFSPPKPGVELSADAARAKLTPLLADLDNKDPKVRSKALEEIATLGPHAAPAIGRLMLVWRQSGDSPAGPNSKRDKESSYYARHTLSVIGKPAVPALIEVVNGRDLDDRVGAISILGDIGPDAAEGVEVLVRELRSRHPTAGKGLRSTSAYSLGQIGPLAVKARDALRAALADPDAEVQANAAKSLKQIDPGYAKKYGLE
jgi:HEAT repeat protein